MNIVALILAFVVIPDTPSIADSALGDDQPVLSASHGFAGATHQDAIIATNAAANILENPFTMQRHLKALYGDQWRNQAKRALAERCSRLIEEPNCILTLCDYDPRNLICRPVDCPIESYDSWSRRNQRLWFVYKDHVRSKDIYTFWHHSDQYFVAYNKFSDDYTVYSCLVSPYTKLAGSKRGWFAKDSGLKYYIFIGKGDDAIKSALDYLLNPDRRINPIYHDTIKAYFRTRTSFCVPLYGSYIFTEDAFFEELSHQMNVGVLKTEWRSRYDTPVTEIPEGFRSVTKWSEFVVAMAGAKQNAFERGFDVGVDGGFVRYFSTVEALAADAIYYLEQGWKHEYADEVARCTLRLLGAYKAACNIERASAAYGSLVPNGVARFLSWCRSPAVGRMVL